MVSPESTQNEPFQIVLTLDTPVGYDYDDGPISLGDKVIERLVRTLTDKFEAQAQKQLHEALKSSIETKATELVEAAVNAPIRKTNTWGEPVGEPTSLRDMIDQKVKEFLGSRIDSGYTGSHPRTFIQNMVGKQVEASMQKEFAAAIQQGKEELLKAVKGHAAEVISESLRRAVNL